MFQSFKIFCKLKEWGEIKSMKSVSNNQLSNSVSSTAIKMTESSQTSNLSSLVYLEAIHIFAIANLLRRPIIVVSFDYFKDIQPIFLKGVYLPILWKSEHCEKHPIILAYHNFHFLPLLTALDDESLNVYKIQNNDKYFHFENIQSISKLGQDDYEKSVTLKNTESYLMKKNKIFYNYFPLVRSDFEPIPVLFLAEEEKPNSDNLLKEYLKTKVIDIDLNDAKSFNKNYLDELNGARVLCCEISRKITTFEEDGIKNYLKFLNDSTNRGYICLKRGCTNPSVKDEKYQGLCFNCHKVSVNQAKKTLNPDHYCKNQNCSNPIADEKFLGYCNICYKDYLTQTNASNSPVSNSSTSINQDNLRVISSSGKPNLIKETDKLEIKKQDTKSNFCKKENCSNLAKLDDDLKGFCSDCFKDIISVRSMTNINSQTNEAKATLTETSQGSNKSQKEATFSNPHVVVNENNLNNTFIIRIETKAKKCKRTDCYEIIQSSSSSLDYNDYCDRCMETNAFEKLEKTNSPNLNDSELSTNKQDRFVNSHQKEYTSPASFTPSLKSNKNQGLNTGIQIADLITELNVNLIKETQYNNTNNNSPYAPYVCNKCYRPSQYQTCSSCSSIKI